jgi:hypothetical protein
MANSSWELTAGSSSKEMSRRRRRKDAMAATHKAKRCLSRPQWRDNAGSGGRLIW